MGFFSKLLKDLGEDPSKKVNDVGAQLMDGLLNSAASARPQPTQRPVQQKSLSVYDNIPAEENLFNFNGPYQTYFRRIFAEDFPGYEVAEQPAPHGKGTLFIFMRSGIGVLVVEVMSEDCTSNRVRRECEQAGNPYLRYYYNHWGWWNTRSYVRNRTRMALGL